MQAAWDRDQELIFQQKDEISLLKHTVNQLKQKHSAGDRNTGRVALGAIINGIKISEGDVVDYEHNEAGGGTRRKKVIFDDNYGVLVERPYNCSKYYNLADLKFKVVL